MSFHDNNSIPGDGGRIHIQQNGMVQFGDRSHVNVTFYKKSVLDPVQSRELGRPKHVGRDYVRIQHPGEKDYSDDPVENKPWTKHEFARQWAQYQQSQEQVPDGTPVEMLFIQNPEIAANLHGFAVHTVEQLANLTEHGAQSIGMGATEWRNRARSWLEKANKGVGAHKLEAALAERDNKLEVQANQIAQLQAQINKLLAERQGVPGTMIPSAPMPAAQAYAMSGYDPPLTVEWAAPESAPIQVHQGVVGPSITETPQKAPRGWPKGKPRKPRETSL